MANKQQRRFRWHTGKSLDDIIEENRKKLSSKGKERKGVRVGGGKKPVLARAARPAQQQAGGARGGVIASIKRGGAGPRGGAGQGAGLGAKGGIAKRRVSAGERGAFECCLF